MKPPAASAASATPDAADATLAAANVLLRVAARSVVEVEGIVTTPQLRVLVLIKTSGPQNMTQVAAELKVHASNATRTCEALVQAGLIDRSDNPADRRRVRLVLTEKGDELVEHVLASRRRKVAAILNTMPPEDRERLALAFSDFAHAAGEGPSPDGRFTMTLH